MEAEINSRSVEAAARSERRKPPPAGGSKDENSENGSRTVVRSMVSFNKVALENELCDGEGRARLLLLLVCWASLPACLPSVQGWLDTLPRRSRAVAAGALACGSQIPEQGMAGAGPAWAVGLGN